MTVVYWIRLKEHNDIATQGYVGVANNIKQRLNRHKTRTSKLDCHLANAIKKYGWDNLIKEIVFDGLAKDCYEKEKELRPNYQIGWNESIGGLGGDRSCFIDYKNRKNLGWIYDKSGLKNPFYGKSHTKQSIEKMKLSKSKHKITTPDGVFIGFNSVADFYQIHKITAKKWASKLEGWSYESI